MTATIISDKEFQDNLYQMLEKQILEHLKGQGFETKVMKIGNNDLTYCKGCFECWVKKPGECCFNDMMAEINRNFINSDAVLYISPVIFGQFSANIKNAIDRWLPNILPFFIRRNDGSTMHPSRYGRVPKQVMIGYGENIDNDDRQLFADIIKKHRKNIEVIIAGGPGTDLSMELGRIELEKVGGKL